MLVRYLNGGTIEAGKTTIDGSIDSGIEACDQDDDSHSDNSTENDREKCADNVSKCSGGRYKISKKTGESTSKKVTQQHLPPVTTTWSPPSPISFRIEQQQQHRVTHGPGGEHLINNEFLCYFNSIYMYLLQYILII